jgi:hypothetical protein
MVEYFSRPIEEPKYLGWLGAHKKAGYVANRWRDGTVMLHHADCGTLTANRYRKVTPQYSKLCGDGKRELLARVKEDWNPGDIRECSMRWHPG